VTNNGDGTWRCDRCDRSVPDCDYRSAEHPAFNFLVAGFTNLYQ
jgi:hypothetical protein